MPNIVHAQYQSMRIFSIFAGNREIK